MKSADLRQLSAEELEARVTQWEEDRFRARCNSTMGQLQNPNVLRTLRRDVARAKTIIKEKARDAGNQQ